MEKRFFADPTPVITQTQFWSGCSYFEGYLKRTVWQFESLFLVSLDLCVECHNALMHVQHKGAKTLRRDFQTQVNKGAPKAVHESNRLCIRLKTFP